MGPYTPRSCTHSARGHYLYLDLCVRNVYRQCPRGDFPQRSLHTAVIPTRTVPEAELALRVCTLKTGKERGRSIAERGLSKDGPFHGSFARERIIYRGQ